MGRIKMKYVIIRKTLRQLRVPGVLLSVLQDLLCLIDDAKLPTTKWSITTKCTTTICYGTITERFGWLPDRVNPEATIRMGSRI